MVQMIQNDEMGRIWKGVVNCVLWWYPRIFLERLRRTMNKTAVKMVKN
jgi:hypothetical protein